MFVNLILCIIGDGYVSYKYLELFCFWLRIAIVILKVIIDMPSLDVAIGFEMFAFSTKEILISL